MIKDDSKPPVTREDIEKIIDKMLSWPMINQEVRDEATTAIMKLIGGERDERKNV